PITLSVNLSAKQIYQPDILDKIDKILASTRINPRHLKFELTESVLIDNTEVARETLAQIRGRNIRLSLDDFGTGYSSLSYLHQFSLDTIKIDRSFVNLEKLELVKTIITLAHDLGMDVVAEGVETQQQKLYLKELGCESAQGYLFYRPLDSQGIETLLNQLDFPSD
ncbi:MAG: EAL domain-containing protein, partial [Prochloraceae cyanobacterium]